jgi:hypothetical protein
LYINNLVNDLKIGHTHPLIVGDVTVTSLLYADDIILVSESKEGLQNGLNIIYMGGGAAVAHIIDPPSKQCRKPFVDQ